MKVSAKVVGFSELEKSLREIRAEMGGAEGNIVASALRKAAKDTVLEAQKREVQQHTKTGRLLRSLKIVKHPNPRRWSELYGVGVHNMGKRPAKGGPDDGDLPWYASVVEYGGWNKSGPLKGFMRRSVEHNRKAFIDLFKRELAIKIGRVAKKIGNKNAQAVAAAAKRATSKTIVSRGTIGTTPYKVTINLPGGGG